MWDHDHYETFPLLVSLGDKTPSGQTNDSLVPLKDLSSRVTPNQLTLLGLNGRRPGPVMQASLNTTRPTVFTEPPGAALDLAPHSSPAGHSVPRLPADLVNTHPT
jgi:hypothetical protein